MACRKQKHMVPPKTAFQLLLVLGAMLLIVSILSSITESFVLGAVAVAIVAGAGIFCFRVFTKQSLERKISEAIDENIEVLTRQHAKLVSVDAYGTPQRDQWNKDIEKFFASKVVPHLSGSEKSLLAKERHAWTNLVHGAVSSAKARNPAFASFSPDLSPREFELFCAEELNRIGWNAHCTKASRDQGVDVIAQKNGVRIVLQCKLYNQPVGNKAVQEAFTAKTYEQAHLAAVVSNSAYTVPAQQLAKSSGVLLLHYSELRNMDALARRVPDVAMKAQGR